MQTGRTFTIIIEKKKEKKDENMRRITTLSSNLTSSFVKFIEPGSVDGHE